MPLEVTRNFVENRDSTYDLYEVPKVQVENMDDSYRSKQTPIRPFELKTFLKVGRYTHYVFLGRPTDQEYEFFSVNFTHLAYSFNTRV